MNISLLINRQTTTLLHINWLTEKHIDFEYKKYLLLDYLQKIDLRFREVKLYPYYHQLISQHKSLTKLRNIKIQLAESFNQELKAIDLDKYKMQYQRLINDDDLMKEIDSIIDYSIPKFEFYIKEGNSIHDLVKEKLHVCPIGITPIYNSEGYMLLKNATRKNTHVFQYDITFYNKTEEKHRAIRTKYIASHDVSISNTLENIKSELIRINPELPIPATYMLESELELPVYETLLPIAKKVLVKFVSTTTG